MYTHIHTYLKGYCSEKELLRGVEKRRIALVFRVIFVLAPQYVALCVCVRVCVCVSVCVYVCACVFARVFM